MPHPQPHIDKLLTNRYYLRDEEGNLLETEPYQMYRRVAFAIAQAEGFEHCAEWSDKFYFLMHENKFLPNTPTLINAGKERPGSFSACFVLPVEDSMEGIFKAVSNAALIMKAGGGVGFNFGRLREKGAIVKTTGHESSGPISFMKVFDSACETISQGGVRRGAMIGILPVWHPDIEEFIEMKADGKSFSNFNISVGITDAFMEAIEKDEDWYLIPPVYKDLQKIPTAYLKTINARSLWNKIVEQAHKTGDPGLFFLDTVNKAHPLNDEIESSNPCWSGSTKVWTVEHGWTTFRELEKLGDTEVFSWDGSKIVTKMMRNPRQTAVNTRIVEVAVRGSGAKSGQVSYLRCTYNHQLYLKDGTKVLAKDLKPGDNLSSVYIHKANSKGYISASCNGCSELVHNIVMETPEGFHAHHKNEITSDNRRSNLELQELHTHMSDHKKGGKNPIHKLTAKGKNYLLTLPTDGKNNGRYNDFVDNKEVVRLRDEEKLSWKEVCSRVGLAPNVKTIKNRYQWGLEELQDNHTVISVEDCAFDSVYNGTVDDTHNYFVACGENDGILSANCGEIPLRPYESCNLGSINLMAYLKEIQPNTEKLPIGGYEFNWNSLEEDIPTMVRFLDDVIDVNPYPLPEIDKASKESRKIGLGIMGWADCLIKMKIPYDSQEAIDLAEELIEFIYDTAYDSSLELAVEKGKFPLQPDKEMPRRNATLLTVAPTGCSKKETMVVSDKGILKLSEVGDVSGDTWQDIEMQISQETGTTTATRYYVNGEQRTKKISLYSGIELESTLNHKYRVFTDKEEYLWKKVEDLKPGDNIAVRIGGYHKEENYSLIPSSYNKVTSANKSIVFPSEVTAELAFLLGVIWGDGSTHSKGIRVHFNNNATREICFISDRFRGLFNIEPIVRQERTCTTVYANSQELLCWLEDNGLKKGYSTDIEIPIAIRCSSAESIAAFIDGVFFADGSITGVTKYIDTSSKEFAQQLLVCMRAIGQNGRIVTREKINGRKSAKPSYRVFFTKFGSIEKGKYYKRVPNVLKDKELISNRVGPEIYMDEVISIEDGFCETFDIEVPTKNTYLANSAVSHNTLSRIAGVSSGIEPIFAWRTHHKLEGHEYDETHWAYEDNWNEHIAGKPDYMKTANEIAPELHLRMQAAFQKYVDNSISKTINLPNDAPVDTVNEIYRRAWEMGLKGITIYRDGSKEYQPLNKIEPYKVNLNDFSKEEQKALIEEPSLDEIINKNRLRKRGPVAIGVTHKVDTGRGKIYITINYSEYHSEPVEVFIRLGHLSTPTEAALAEWSGRLISMLLKYNVPLESVMRQGNKVYADTTFWYNQQAFCSLPKLISHLLGFTFEEALDMADLDFDAFLENGDEYYEENEPIEEKEETTYGYCYHCGTYGMIGESGCKVCNNCGYEECG